MDLHSFDSDSDPAAIARRKELESAFAAAAANPMSPDELITGLKCFIRRFLVCPDYQLTLLALWIMHTYCFGSFRVTPYLNIWSPEKQCGKTICMQLLSILASKAWIPSGVTPSALMRRISNNRPTVLLDDWQTTLKSSETQAVIGFLTASSFYGNIHTAFHAQEHKDLFIFSPKAFAGPASLPLPLADRSIPIILQRRKPGESVTPFWLRTALRECRPLVIALLTWADKNQDHILDCAQAAQLSPLPRLSMRQQECAQPLLVIARAIGGKWPRKARIALLRAFEAYDRPDLTDASLLLSDIQSCFAHKGVEKIHTVDLLEHLHGLNDRPWKKWNDGKPLDPVGLRKLLRDVGVRRTSSLRIGNHNHKGFRRQDFVDSWERYPSTPASQEPGASAQEVGTNDEKVGTTAQEVGTNDKKVGTKTSEVGTKKPPSGDNSNVFNDYDVLTA